MASSFINVLGLSANFLATGNGDLWRNFSQTEEAPRTPLEDLVPFTEAFWELPCSSEVHPRLQQLLGPLDSSAAWPPLFAQLLADLALRCAMSKVAGSRPHPRELQLLVHFAWMLGL